MDLNWMWHESQNIVVVVVVVGDFWVGIVYFAYKFIALFVSVDFNLLTRILDLSIKI